MKIAVNLIIDLDDPAQWSLTFGPEGNKEIRQDVKEYVLDMVQQAAVFNEIDGTVTARP